MDKKSEFETNNDASFGERIDGSITVFVVRHGSTSLNEQNRLRGWLDVPLSPEGEKQAKSIGKFFSDIQLGNIYCSDLSRAQSTAAPISKASGAIVSPTAMLRPINFGALQGRPVEEIKPEMESVQAKWETDPDARVPDGESFREFQDRNVKALEAILAAAKPGSQVALVAHLRNAIYFLSYVINGGPLEGKDLELLGRVTQDVAGISVLKFNKETGEMQVHKQNYTEHLDDESGGEASSGQLGEDNISRLSSWFVQADRPVDLYGQKCPSCSMPSLGQCRCAPSVRHCANNHQWHFCPADGSVVMGEPWTGPQMSRSMKGLDPICTCMSKKAFINVEASNAGILIGTSGFKYKHWSGTFYPKDVPGREWLKYYSTKFPTVEISSTFHHMPEQRVLQTWHDSTPEDFTFAIRAPKAVTHEAHLVGSGPLMSAFMRRLEHLGDKLGPVTFQLLQSERFDPDVFKAFAASLPSGFRYSMEFRSEPWYNDAAYDIMREYNIANVIVGHSNMGIHTVQTADWSHVRMSGHHPDYKQNSYTDEQLMNWRGIVADSKRPAFVYFNNEYMAFAAHNAQKLMDLMAIKYKSRPSKPKKDTGPRNINPDSYGAPVDSRSNEDGYVEQHDVSEKSPDYSPNDQHIMDTSIGAPDW